MSDIDHALARLEWCREYWLAQRGVESAQRKAPDEFDRALIDAYTSRNAVLARAGHE